MKDITYRPQTLTNIESGVFCMGKHKVNTHRTREVPMWDSATWRRARVGLQESWRRILDKGLE